ncbi:MAG: hypothetical protein IK104_03885 [Clostridia bacterium]|nr:hypothetical protein [Clostridia bacterium]
MRNYIQNVLSNIRDKRLQKEVQAELTDHILSAQAELTALGCGLEEAEKRAEAALGEDAEGVGLRLNRIHRGRTALRAAVTVLPTILLLLYYGLQIFFNNLSAEAEELWLSPAVSALILTAICLLTVLALKKRSLLYLLPAAALLAEYRSFAPAAPTLLLMLLSGRGEAYVHAAERYDLLNTHRPEQMIGIVLLAVLLLFSFVRIVRQKLRRTKRWELSVERILGAALLTLGCLFLLVFAAGIVFQQTAPEDKGFEEWYFLFSDTPLTEEELSLIREDIEGRDPKDDPFETKRNAWFSHFYLSEECIPEVMSLRPHFDLGRVHHYFMEAVPLPSVHQAVTRLAGESYEQRIELLPDVFMRADAMRANVSSTHRYLTVISTYSDYSETNQRFIYTMDAAAYDLTKQHVFHLQEDFFSSAVILDLDVDYENVS